MSGLLFVFKFLLCNKLENVSKLDYSEVGPRIQLMDLKFWNWKTKHWANVIFRWCPQCSSSCSWWWSGRASCTDQVTWDITHNVWYSMFDIDGICTFIIVRKDEKYIFYTIIWGCYLLLYDLCVIGTGIVVPSNKDGSSKWRLCHCPCKLSINC